jgi:hypothetical protein
MDNSTPIGDPAPMSNCPTEADESDVRIGRLIQRVALGPVAWTGGLGGMLLPSSQVLLWGGVIVPAVGALIGWGIDKGQSVAWTQAPDRGEEGTKTPGADSGGGGSRRGDARNESEPSPRGLGKDEVVSAGEPSGAADTGERSTR